MPHLVMHLISILLIVIITGIVTWFIAISHRKSTYEAKIGTAEERARNIINDAIKVAESKKREAVLEAKEETLKAKNEFELECKERRIELQKYEQYILNKEETTDKKAELLEKKDLVLTNKDIELTDKLNKVNDLLKEKELELEKIANLTMQEARENIMFSIEEELQHDKANMIRLKLDEIKEEVNKKSVEILVSAIQKCACDHVSENLISVVHLPNEEMKGRIIGREGRNIKSLESVTGVEIIIDDTPEAVILSSFDLVRREIARLSLERLIQDGRIHPARIEEVVEKTRRDIELQMKEDGENALYELGIHGIHPEIVKLIGKLKYRTSYGQNVLKHSMEVANLAGLMAIELGLDVNIAKRAGLLHDIGKALDNEIEGTHVEIGVDICKKYKESQTVINAVASHHGDVEPTSPIAFIVMAADTISAARPGARRENIETYINRLKKLEEIANSYEGVEKSFAIQAGRELRIMVTPEKITDDEMTILAYDISRHIERELQYPGQIKVNVIKELRVADYAK